MPPNLAAEYIVTLSKMLFGMTIEDSTLTCMQ